MAGIFCIFELGFYVGGFLFGGLINVVERIVFGGWVFGNLYLVGIVLVLGFG